MPLFTRRYPFYQKPIQTVCVAACLGMQLLASPASAQTLSQAEISNQLIGTEVKFRNTRGTKGNIFYQVDGSLTWRNERGLKGLGQWRFDGNKLCSKLFPTTTFQGRDWRCFAVKKRFDGRYRWGSAGTLWR